MRAIRCNQYGPPESLTVENLPELLPEAGQVVIDPLPCGFVIHRRSERSENCALKLG